MAAGRIDPSLTWVKSNVVSALIQPYQSEADGLEKIASTLRSQYRAYAKIDSLVATAQDLYRQNFFPEMRADWRAYPDHSSHKNWAGCFRCHDGNHKARDGKNMIKASDCNSCHTILAQGSGEQLQKLVATGHTFFHVDAEYSDFSCNQCHTGAFIK